MGQLLQFLLGLAAVAAGIGGALFLLLRLEHWTGARPERPRRTAMDRIEPPVPGWTEAIGGDGAHIYARAQSVHPELMRQDARGRRGEFTMHAD